MRQETMAALAEWQTAEPQRRAVVALQCAADGRLLADLSAGMVQTYGRSAALGQLGTLWSAVRDVPAQQTGEQAEVVSELRNVPQVVELTNTADRQADENAQPQDAEPTSPAESNITILQG